MTETNRVLLVGWDAADWKVIHELMDAGKMPNVQKLVENGVMGNMRTLHPPLSPMLWTSIATGKRPYKHGIYGFIEPTPDGSAVQPMTNVSRTCKAIWNILNQNGKRSVVVGWWPSHPAEPINGVMVSDYFNKAPKSPSDPWNLSERSVHPAERLREIAEFRVHPMELQGDDIQPFLPEGAEIDQSVDSRVSVVMKMTAEATTVQATATYLLEQEEWDFAAVYFDAIDHYSHAFMRYRAPQQASVSDDDFRHYRHVVDTAYMYHDLMLGRLMELAGPDARVVLMSDHGFHPDHLRPQFIPAEPAGPASEHREIGIFVASGPGIRKDEVVHGANLLDVTPTILTMFGLPVGEDMDGRSLDEIFVQTPKIPPIDSWENVAGDDGRHPPGTIIQSADTKAALDQLVALGYIDAPDKDSSKTVEQCVRELDYNLARAYMDGGMYGEATPLLINLYSRFPLEFRFGIQLANCFRVIGRTQELADLIEDLRNRWGTAQVIARRKLKEISVVTRERREHWKRLKKMDEENPDPNMPRLARVNMHGKPLLFDEAEMQVIRKLRAISKGNPESLDFLAATVAMSQGNFEEALQIIDAAKLAETRNPIFQYQLGNVYLELNCLDDAERAFLLGLEVDELNANCLLGLCRVWLKTDLLDKALEAGRKALGLQFQFPVAHYFVGQCLMAKREAAAAINSLETALHQNPNFAEAHDALAEIYERPGGDKGLAEFHRLESTRLTEENRKQVSEKTWEPVRFSREQLEVGFPDILDDTNNEEFLRCLAQAKKTTPEISEPNKVPEVIIVSGLPRSGTSMMMQMLVAGGLQPFTDNVRQADESNPKGYYEAELVKNLSKRNDWVKGCDQQVIKVVAPLVPKLPQGVRYKVIFMRRPMNEVVGSQTDMLKRLGEAGPSIDEDKLGFIFRQQAYSAISLLTLHDNPVLRLAYDDVVENPRQAAEAIQEFLGRPMNIEAMADVVAPELSRQKQKNADK